jgi:polar amino acid transport system substrate-binding protein
MGITEHETKVFEWSGLIPGINANRSDMVTGGMYILKSRCANMNFSDPIGVFGDAMMVPKGNPQGINNYADVVRTGAKLVTGAGFNTVEAAKKYGVPESQMMLVEGEVGILAAMKAGRADVAVQTFFGAKEHEEKTGGKFEVTDPKLMPKETLNVVGIGFRKTDVEFRDNFNKALAKVMANPATMLERAGEYGYDKAQLPPPSMSTEWACSTK